MTQHVVEMDTLLSNQHEDETLHPTHGTIVATLMKAIEQDDAQEVKDILSNNSAQRLINIWFGESYNATPLEFACEKGSKDVLKTMLDFVPNKHILSELKDGYSAFHYAASGGNVNILKLIMSMEVVDINLKTANGDTALHLAASNGRAQCVELLLENSKVDVNASNYTLEEPLHKAAYEGHIETVLQLLDNGANINNKTNYGYTPLLCAASKEHVEIVSELLKRGANATVCDHDKDTALHFLSQKCSSQLLSELLQSGALLGVQNRMGITPLNGLQPEVIKHLLDLSISSHKILDVDRYKYRKDSKKLLFRNPFVSQNSQTDSDLKNFLALSRSKEHEHLVFHPLFEGNVAMKWQVVQRLYLLRLAIFFLFVICLSAYITLDEINTGFKESDANLVLKICVITLLVVVASFRLIEAIFRWKYNLLKVAHWFELVFIIFNICYLSELKYFAIPTNSLAWITLFLHMSRHPILSPRFYMFNSICLSIIKFMLFAIIPLFAFMQGFIFILNNCYVDSEPCIDGAFSNHLTSALKVFTMLLGEVGMENFPLHYKFYAWAPFLAIFIFFIPLVFQNMINGLAVTDTQELKNRAKFFSKVAQAEMVLSIESIMNDLWCHSIMNRFKILTIPKILTFTVLPSTGECLEAKPDSCIVGMNLPMSVVKSSQVLLEKAENNLLTSFNATNISEPSSRENLKLNREDIDLILKMIRKS